MLTDAPFYLQADGPTLEHQRQNKEILDTEAMRGGERSVVVGRATRFIAGSCHNCGAAGHKEKECTRPKRKSNAAYTNKITGDNTILVDDSGIREKTYQQRHDQWGKLTSDDHNELWQQMQTEDSLPEKRAKTDDGGGAASSRGLFAAHSGDRVVSLRDIGDLPKYLENLGATDVFFDPKTRSLRMNPHAASVTTTTTGTDGAESLAVFRGDNAAYEESSGYIEALERQLFVQTHPEISSSFLATEVELAFREWQQARRSEASAKAAALDAMYGVEDKISSSDDALVAVAASSAPAVVARHTVTPGGASDAAATTELEKARALGHTRVFGSYFDRATALWGYKCCKVCDPAAQCPLK